MDYYSIILIAILGYMLGTYSLYNFMLYKMGRIIKSKYPVRYEKQLTSSRPYITEYFNTKKQFPFPYNIGETVAWRGLVNAKKIMDIARAENDQDLLIRSTRLYKIGLHSRWVGLIVIFTILLVVFWFS